MVIRLREEQKEQIKEKFQEYVNTDKTAKDIADELGLEKSTINKFFSRTFGEKYIKIAKLKMHKHCTKLSGDKIFALFEQYKNGISMKELEKNAGLGYGSLSNRMLKLIGDEYKKVAMKRQHETSGNFFRKVVDADIRKAFEKYKSNAISTTALAKELELAESTLIFRFKKLFKEDYNKLALQRRDERRVSKENYIKAFEEYKNTNISLTDLANKLKVRIPSLRPRFLRLFGQEYIKIATQKSDASVLINRGKLAEYIALEYFKLSGIAVNDVRKKAILKGSLKRPDFVFEDTFIEIKSNYIKFIYKRKVKGYRNIVDDYLGKETKAGRILTKGIIISLGGFSDEVRKKAKEDGITLIDDKDLRKNFEDNNRVDLLEVISELKGNC